MARVPLISQTVRTTLSYIFMGLACLAGVLVLQVIFELSKGGVREPTVAALGLATLLAAALHCLAHPPKTSDGGSRLKHATLIASLLLGVALVFLSQSYLKSSSVIVTDASQWNHTTLPDGSVMHLDARTKVKVEFRADARILHLYEGGTVIEVTKDPRRPFIVRTSLVDVVAVGTRFGVSIDSGVTTTVSEGSVKLIRAGHMDDPSVTLKAGEELRVLPTQKASLLSLQPVPIDAARKLDWANGWLILTNDMTVAQAVGEFNRRNRLQIVVDSPTLGARRLHGFARLRIDAPERYAAIIAKESGATMTLDKWNDVIRLTE